MKNIVFIPNINLGNGRSDSYQYSIKSWKYWCDKNDVYYESTDTRQQLTERIKKAGYR